jgi:hypothetical protein
LGVVPPALVIIADADVPSLVPIALHALLHVAYVPDELSAVAQVANCAVVTDETTAVATLPSAAAPQALFGFDQAPVGVTPGVKIVG